MPEEGGNFMTCICRAANQDWKVAQIDLNEGVKNHNVCPPLLPMSFFLIKEMALLWFWGCEWPRLICFPRTNLIHVYVGDFEM